jgi:hypothetical protein
METGSTYSSVTIGCSVLMEVISLIIMIIMIIIIIIIMVLMMIIIILILLLLNCYCRKHLHEFQARSVDE